MNEARDSQVVVSSGTSMFPLIRDGMIVTLRRIPPGEISIGDIVAFPGADKTILHRIIRKRGDQWFEKGDNRRTGTWIDAASYTGKAISCEDAGVIRDLDVPSNSFRLRALSFLSRAESSIFGCLLAVSRALLGKSSPRVLSSLGWLASLITMPFRLVLGPMLLSVYPSRAREEDPADLAKLVSYFCDIGGEPPAGMDGLLATHGLDAIAAMKRDGAKAARYRAAFLFMNAVATLGDVQRVMQGQGIPYAILKGPPLAHALYGDGALRASVDIDVLVRLEDRDRAAAALAAAGYSARGSKFQQLAVKRGHFHLVFDPPQKNRLTVELHWALVDRANLYRIDESEIQGRWTTTNVEGVDVGVLSREDEFLYLLLHIAKHGLFNGYGLERGEPAEWFCRSITGNRLIWFLDVQKFLEKFGDTLNWPALRESSNRWNISDAVFQSLEVLNRLRPNSVAAEALEKLGYQARSPAFAQELRRGKPIDTKWVMKWMKANKNFVIRPARLLMLGQLLFPPGPQLGNFYRHSKCPLALLRIGHPFWMLVRLIRG